MNCKDVQKNLEVRNADGVPCDHAQEIQAHLSSCQACRFFYDDIRQLRNTLNRAELPPLPETIQRRLHAPCGKTTHLFRWTAAAALLLVTFTLGFLVAVNLRSGNPVPAESTRISHTVVLAIDSAGDRHGVTLRLLLPPGVEVDGHPGETVLEWHDDLVAGVNRLRIPLTLSGQDHGMLITQVEYQGKIQELQVHLGHLTEEPPTKTGEPSPRRAT